VQSQVILWLAALPLVLAMFRAITIGDRLYAPVQQGLAGGHHKQLINLALAGLTFVGIMLFLVIGAAQPGQVEDPLVLVLIAFGAFVLSAYMAAGFRARTWQKFVAHAFHEAGLYWLVLGLCRIMLILTDRPAPAQGQDQPAQAQLVFLESAIWAVVAAVTLALIIGTGARMMRR
jgi:hypothetical protein